MKRYPNQAGPSVGLWAIVIMSVALVYLLMFGTNVPKELEKRVTTLERNTDTILK
jgi:hypothetical protein